MLVNFERFQSCIPKSSVHAVGDNISGSDKTEEPDPSSSLVWWDSLSPTERAKVWEDQRYEDDHKAAKLFAGSDLISDSEMGYPFTVPPGTQGGLILTWTDRGEEQSRQTNLKPGVRYHCRIFSYDAAKEEWLGQSDFCHVDRLLTVETKGASREPLVGECSGGRLMGVHCVFKQYRLQKDHTPESYLADVRAQTIAGYYVNRFREATNDKFGWLCLLPVQFVAVFETSERSKIIEIMTCERHHEQMAGPDGPDKFEKFTNNLVYKNRDVDTTYIEALSHFSYEESEGSLMVVDLQGWAGRRAAGDHIGTILTDPVIHCRGASWSLLGRGNKGVEGMRRFFMDVHPQCNDICRKLKLKRPDEFDSHHGP